MDFSKLNLTGPKFLKIIGIVILSVILIAILIILIGSSLFAIRGGVVKLPTGSSVMPYDYSGKGGGNVAYESSIAPSISTRNVAGDVMIYPGVGQSTGTTAEQFEVTDYSVGIETRNLDITCGKITSLKKLEYVIFESVNQYDHGCNYVFKVKHANVEEILTAVKDLNPKDISENTFTIKTLVDDYTAEIDILQKKLASIDDTLKKAIGAYDDVTVLATRVNDVESLAKIIDSKLNTIGRLTQERIEINSQLERINRSKAEQIDRLDFTYFRVNVFENKFIDGQTLKDSWKAAIKNFFGDLNKIFLGITVNLVLFILFVVQCLVYFFIVLVLAKYIWKYSKRLWVK